jgi:hypothetical protein
MATEPEIIDGPERRVSPILIVLLVVLALGALFFLVIRPLFLAQDEPQAPPEGLPSPAATEPEPEPSPSPTAPPEETFEVFESKDPFRPLVVAAANGAATDGAATDGTTNGTQDGATDGAAGAPAPTGGNRVTLLDVLTDRQQAQVRVGSTVYTVAEGEVFADNFKLVTISGECATFLHGDDRFTLCEGEEVIK